MSLAILGFLLLLQYVDASQYMMSSDYVHCSTGYESTCFALKEQTKIYSVDGDLDITLNVRAHRVTTDVFSFTTRVYCYMDVCSVPGPTIVVKPGDRLTVTLVNDLDYDNGTMVMNTMHTPNKTNLHTHGLHIGPDVDNVFISINGGENYTYVYDIPSDHHAGNHWYHAHHHGASAFHVMGGQVGALIVETKLTTHIPAAWRSVTRKVLTFTHVHLEMTDGSDEGTDPFTSWSYSTLSEKIGNKLDFAPEYYMQDDDGFSVSDAWFVNGQYQPYLSLYKNEWIILDLICASGDRLLELEVRTAIGSDNGVEVNNLNYCETHLLALDGVYLTNSRSGSSYVSTRHLVLLQSQRATIAFKCSRAGTYYFQTVANTTHGDSKDIGDSEVKSAQNLVTIIVENFAVNSPVTISDFSLSTIPRPSYISSLLTRSVSAAQQWSASVEQTGCCDEDKDASFWIGIGKNCSLHCFGRDDCESLYGAEGTWDVQDFQNVKDGLCYYESFPGEIGTSESSISSYTHIGSLNTVTELSWWGRGKSAHPMHIHVSHFQIVSHMHSGSSQMSPYGEVGDWRDTWPSLPGVSKVRMVFSNYTGEYVTHCHFLKHEDLGMMATFLVTSNAPTFVPTEKPSGSSPVKPTVVPTKSPTFVPSRKPSIKPTNKPTLFPSLTPSSMPSTAFGTVDYSLLHASSIVKNCDSTTSDIFMDTLYDVNDAAFTESSSSYFSGPYVKYTASAIPNYYHVVTTNDINYLSGRPNKNYEIKTINIVTSDTVEFGSDVGFQCYAGAADQCACVSRTTYTYCANSCSNSACSAVKSTGAALVICSDEGAGWWPPGPTCAADQSTTYDMSIPLKPRPNIETTTSKRCYVSMGTQGWFVNGVAFFGWSDGLSYNNQNVFHNVALNFELYDFDICYGHAANGLYHHHTWSPCLAEQVGDNGLGHSPVYGFARDGFPIYGPFHDVGLLAKSCWKKRNYEGTKTAAGGWGCMSSSTDTTNKGKRTCLLSDQFNPSSTTTASTSGPSIYSTVKSQSGNSYTAESGAYYEDYYFDTSCQASGEEYLDVYNGHDHDDLGWHYHLTVNASGHPVFPFAIGPQFYGTLPSASDSQCCSTLVNALSGSCAGTKSNSAYQSQGTSPGADVTVSSFDDYSNCAEYLSPNYDYVYPFDVDNVVSIPGLSLTLTGFYSATLDYTQRSAITAAVADASFLLNDELTLSSYSAATISTHSYTISFAFTVTANTIYNDYRWNITGFISYYNNHTDNDDGYGIDVQLLYDIITDRYDDIASQDYALIDLIYAKCEKMVNCNWDTMDNIALSSTRLAIPSSAPSRAPSYKPTTRSPSYKPTTRSPSYTPTRSPSYTPTTQSPSYKPTAATPTEEASLATAAPTE